MPNHDFRDLVPHVAVMLVVLTVCFAGSSLLESPAQQPNRRPLTVVHLEDEQWKAILQPGFRTIYFRPESITSFVYWPESPLDDHSETPTIEFYSGPNSFILYCASHEDAEAVVNVFGPLHKP